MTRVAAFAAPILPGKTEDWKEFCEEMQGVHRHAYEQSCRTAGITREAMWLQHTTEGDIAIIYIEANDPQRALQIIAESDGPFDRWFREWILDIHGVDLTHPSFVLEHVFDWRVS